MLDFTGINAIHSQFYSLVDFAAMNDPILVKDRFGQPTTTIRVYSKRELHDRLSRAGEYGLSPGDQKDLVEYNERLRRLRAEQPVDAAERTALLEGQIRELENKRRLKECKDELNALRARAPAEQPANAAQDIARLEREFRNLAVISDQLEPQLQLRYGMQERDGTNIMAIAYAAAFRSIKENNIVAKDNEDPEIIEHFLSYYGADAASVKILGDAGQVEQHQAIKDKVALLASHLRLLHCFVQNPKDPSLNIGDDLDHITFLNNLGIDSSFDNRNNKAERDSKEGREADAARAARSKADADMDAFALLLADERARRAPAAAPAAANRPAPSASVAAAANPNGGAPAAADAARGNAAAAAAAANAVPASRSLTYDDLELIDGTFFDPIAQEPMTDPILIIEEFAAGVDVKINREAREAKTARMARIYSKSSFDSQFSVEAKSFDEYLAAEITLLDNYRRHYGYVPAGLNGQDAVRRFLADPIISIFGAPRDIADSINTVIALSQGLGLFYPESDSRRHKRTEVRDPRNPNIRLTKNMKQHDSKTLMAIAYAAANRVVQENRGEILGRNISAAVRTKRNAVLSNIENYYHEGSGASRRYQENKYRADLALLEQFLRNPRDPKLNLQPEHIEVLIGLGICVSGVDNTKERAVVVGPRVSPTPNANADAIVVNPIRFAAAANPNAAANPAPANAAPRAPAGGGAAAAAPAAPAANNAAPRPAAPAANPAAANPQPAPAVVPPAAVVPPPAPARVRAGRLLRS